MSRPQPLGCLLDEDLDPSLAEPLDSYPAGWNVTTVRAQGWLGVKNGPLLDAMAEAHLRVLMTGDRALHAQRRAALVRLRIGVVLIRDPARAAEHIQEIARAVVRVEPGELVEVPTV